jgi:hypothetical protein
VSTETIVHVTNEVEIVTVEEDIAVDDSDLMVKDRESFLEESFHDYTFDNTIVSEHRIDKIENDEMLRRELRLEPITQEDKNYIMATYYYKLSVIKPPKVVIEKSSSSEEYDDYAFGSMGRRNKYDVDYNINKQRAAFFSKTKKSKKQSQDVSNAYRLKDVDSSKYTRKYRLKKTTTRVEKVVISEEIKMTQLKSKVRCSGRCLKAEPIKFKGPYNPLWETRLIKYKMDDEVLVKRVKQCKHRRSTFGPDPGYNVQRSIKKGLEIESEDETSITFFLSKDRLINRLSKICKEERIYLNYNYVFLYLTNKAKFSDKSTTEFKQLLNHCLVALIENNDVKCDIGAQFKKEEISNQAESSDKSKVLNI